MSIEQFRPTEELEPEVVAILIQIQRLTAAKDHWILGLVFEATTVLVGVLFSIPGLLARERPFRLPTEW